MNLLRSRIPIGLLGVRDLRRRRMESKDMPSMAMAPGWFLVNGSYGEA